MGACRLRTDPHFTERGVLSAKGLRVVVKWCDHRQRECKGRAFGGCASAKRACVYQQIRYQQTDACVFKQQHGDAFSKGCGCVTVKLCGHRQRALASEAKGSNGDSKAYM
jgi:hypothetical protein